MLEKAYEDQLIKLKPHEIVHFASTPEEAIGWIESEMESHSKVGIPKIARKSSTVNRSSFYSAAPLEDGDTVVPLSPWSRLGLTFAAGLACGVALSYARR
jgi:hypothetical protein